MNKILIVDDEIKIREIVKEYCVLNGYMIDEAINGKQAIDKVASNDYDCIVLDIMMPELDGFTACKRIKEIKDIPIIMLSARTDEYDKLHSYDLGIDDYVTKPFSPKELMARIKVILDRRSNKSEVLTYKTLVVNKDARDIFIDDQKIIMTPKEFELLVYLMENKNIALSRENILNSIWGYDYYGDYRTIDTHIKMLRHSLKEYRDNIVTVRALGYKFEV